MLQCYQIKSVTINGLGKQQLRMALFFNITASIFGVLSVFILIVLALVVFFPKIFQSFVERIPFITWQDRGNIVRVGAVIRANAIAKSNFFNQKNWLDNRDGFPLPHYYSQKRNGPQKINSAIKQVRMTMQRTTKELIETIEKSKDPFYEILDFIGVVEQMGPDEVFNADIVRSINEKDQYSFTQECLLGELILNGENPYAIKKLVIQPQISSSRPFQEALFQAFENTQYNHNIIKNMKFEFDLKHLREEVNKGQNIYVLDLKDFREFYSEEPFQNIIPVQILKSVEQIKTVLQLPYAVFVQTENIEKRQKGFICIAAVFRYTKEGSYIVLSPFLKNCTKTVWAFARSSIALSHFNDFTFKTHLGVLHFITSQYDVPLYNFKDFTLKNLPEKRDRLQKFFNYALEPFNKGLEGVNVAAAVTLIHPTYPIVSNVFSATPKIAVGMIMKEAERIDLNNYNPTRLSQANGLDKLLNSHDTEIHFDHELYETMSDYVRTVYDECNVDEFALELMQQINRTIAQFHPDRPPITNLRDFFCSIVFCWIVYHAHTFSNLSVNSNLKLRPGILCQAIPSKQSEWNNIQEKGFFPVTKLLIEMLKLSKAVTVKDDANFLPDVLARRYFKAKRVDDIKIAEIAISTVQKLRKIEHELYIINEERAKNGLFKMAWLQPSRMQASLNI